jgi:hypothetical protein
MTTLSSDTSAKAERVLIDLLRRAPFHKHLEIVSSLIKATRQLSWQGICERHPKETPQALARRFFFLLYPDFPGADRFDEYFLPRTDE